MPWTKDDVEKHKKGLDDTGKAKWVATANAALASCIKKGGSDATCAPQAIRIANGVTGNEGYHIYKKIKQDSYSVETKKYRGKNHLVIPVIMMVEGVHHGSQGPMLHKIDELAKFPESWNGMPVVINHPEIDGINVSANRPDILEQQEIGKIFNTYVKDMKKLAAEVWLDEEMLKTYSQEILDQIQKGIPLEVSLGMFTDEDFVTGEFEGEHYESIAKNHRPDHLALLPGAVGACSLADGCGLGVNTDQSEKDLKVAEIMFNQSLKKEDQKMAEKVECTPCVKKKVDDLIINSQGKYTEMHREMLESLNEDLLDKIAQPTIVEKEIERIVEKEVQVNVLSNEDKAALEYGKTQLKENREKLVKRILSNTKDVWTEELLNAKDLDDLKRIHGMIKEEVVDYTFNGSVGLQLNECKEEPLLPTGMKFKSK